MNLVAIRRVKNERDIVEAFVRRYAAHFDALLVLDDGSSDGTKADRPGGARSSRAELVVGTPVAWGNGGNGFGKQGVHRY